MGSKFWITIILVIYLSKECPARNNDLQPNNNFQDRRNPSYQGGPYGQQNRGPRMSGPPQQPGQGRYGQQFRSAPNGQQPQRSGPYGQAPPQTGQYRPQPVRPGPNGQMPNGQGPNRQGPNGQMPNGQRPNQPGPNGQQFPGPGRNGQGPPGQRPPGQGPPGQGPPGQGPPGQGPSGQGPPGQQKIAAIGECDKYPSCDRFCQHNYSRMMRAFHLGKCIFNKGQSICMCYPFMPCESANYKTSNECSICKQFGFRDGYCQSGSFGSQIGPDFCACSS